MWTVAKLERAAARYKGQATPEGLAAAGLLMEVTMHTADLSRQLVRPDWPMVGFWFEGRDAGAGDTIVGQMVLLGRPAGNHRLRERRVSARAVWRDDLGHWLAHDDEDGLAWAVDARPLMGR